MVKCNQLRPLPFKGLIVVLTAVALTFSFASCQLLELLLVPFVVLLQLLLLLLQSLVRRELREK